MMIERYIGRSAALISAGKHSIVVDTSIGKHGGSADVTITVDSQEAMTVAVRRTVAGSFSASETLDVGVDLGSPVSFDYFDRNPFAFTGKIRAVTVDLL
jgi:arylsulfatase